MRRWFAAASLTLILCTVSAQESRPSKLDPDDEARKAKLVELTGRAASLERAGAHEEALDVLEQILELERTLHGEDAPECLQTLRRLARIHEARGSLGAARECLEDVLSATEDQYGKDHWKATDARLALSDLDLRASLSPEQRDQLAASD